MKIVLKDFEYKGKHLDEVEFEFPQITNVEEVPEEKIKAYIFETLVNSI